MSTAISLAVPRNFAQVDKKVWRSAQPTAADFSELDKKGFTEVLNLREWHTDTKEAEGTRLQLHHLRLNTADIREEDLVKALKILKAVRGPILVHCWHGSDRTGTVIALYRMVIQGWSRDKAIAEMTDPQYGYHAAVYPNLEEYLKKVNVEKLRKAVEE